MKSTNFNSFTAHFSSQVILKSPSPNGVIWYHPSVFGHNYTVGTKKVLLVMCVCVCERTQVLNF